MAILPASAQPPPPDKGSVETGGKFIPKRPDGGQASISAPSREAAEAVLKKDLKLERLDSGKLRIGLVTLDPSGRSIRFAATVNMTAGPVEYAVVSENGKLHESVFATKASPRDIHLAMLLLGVTPAEPEAGPDRSLKIPARGAIRATVEWETNGPPVSRPLAALIALADGDPGQTTSRTLSNDAWLYKGSSFDAGGFMASREGSVVSLIGDGAALVNNPGSDRDRDDIHVPNSQLLPPKGMPVSIVFTCLPGTATPASGATPPRDSKP